MYFFLQKSLDMVYNVKYLVLPEFGNINKDGKDVVSDKEKELSTLINKEYSKLATLELFFESYLKEDVSEEEKNKLLDEYIKGSPVVDNKINDELERIKREMEK